MLISNRCPFGPFHIVFIQQQLALAPTKWHRKWCNLAAALDSQSTVKKKKMHDTISSCLRDASLAPTRLSLVTIEPSSRVRWARCQRESSAGACTTSVYLLRCDANRDARNGEATGLQTCKYLRRLHVVTRTPTLLFGRSAASLSVLDLLPPRQT